MGIKSGNKSDCMLKTVSPYPTQPDSDIVTPLILNETVNISANIK